MTECIFKFSTGDEAFLYNKSIVIFFKGKRKVLSTSVYNGGYREDLVAVYNHDGKQGEGMPCEMLADTYVEHMRLLSERLSLDPERVSGMGTAASMENAVVETDSYKELTVSAIVTGGIETNGGRVGDPANYYKPVNKPEKPGTINIMLLMDCDMPEGTIARALVTCTEAKTAALQELLAGSNYSNGLATGSGTDQTIVIANGDSDLYLEGAGKHSKLGELIGKVVVKAVKRALEKQSGLSPKLQHDVFRRLKRFGVTPEAVWKLYRENDRVLVKPLYLIEAERIAKDSVLLTYTSLYIHLMDQMLWQLIDEQEMREGGQKLLTILAEAFGVTAADADPAGIEGMLKNWMLLFNRIIVKKLHGTDLSVN